MHKKEVQSHFIVVLKCTKIDKDIKQLAQWLSQTLQQVLHFPLENVNKHYFFEILSLQLFPRMKSGNKREITSKAPVPNDSENVLEVSEFF